MITFADLVSLMLTFFVLLFAMSSVQVDQWEKLVDAMNRTLNPPSDTTSPAPSTDFNVGTVFRKRAIDLEYLDGVIQSLIKEDADLSGARVSLLGDRLVISLPGGSMFAPQKALLQDNAKKGVATIGGILRNLNNQVGVLGHTAPGEPGANYRSNWELTMARASAVANELKVAGYPEDIYVFGASDTQFEALSDLSQEQQDAFSQRVDIFIMSIKKGQ